MLKKYQSLFEQFKNMTLTQNDDSDEEQEENRRRAMAAAAAAAASHDMNEAKEIEEELISFAFDSNIPPIRARIINYKKMTKLKQLKTSMIEKFVCLNGTVSRISNTRPFTTRFAFECTKCKSTFVNFLIKNYFIFINKSIQYNMIYFLLIL